jgi:hypothetical protein
MEWTGVVHSGMPVFRLNGPVPELIQAARPFKQLPCVRFKGDAPAQPVMRYNRRVIQSAS